MTTYKRTRELQFYFCLAIISGIILMWLIAPLFYPDTWKGYFQQQDPDSLLFARLLEQSLLKNKILTTDNYAAFPYEAKTGFAPFYMWFLVSFVNLVYSLIPNFNLDPVYVASILPIIIPWITIIFLIFAIYKLSNNKILTLFCALGMLPGYSTMTVSGFMKLDYDYLISFFIWTWIIFGSFYIKTEKHAFVHAGAITTALLISTWTGAPFFYFFACIYCLVLWFYNPKHCKTYLTYSSITMLIGSIIALIFVPRTDDTLKNFISSNVGRYSYIQGLIILLGSFFLMILNRITSYKNPRKIALILMSIFVIIIVCFFHETLSQATGILFQKDPIHSTISELTKGLNYNKIFDGALNKVINLFSPLLFFCPMLLFINLKDINSKPILIILHWISLFLLIAIFYQIRYIRWLGCGYGLAIGFIIFYFWNMLKNINIQKNNISKTFISLLPLLLIIITFNYSTITYAFKFKKEEIEFLSWIKKYTKPTSGYSEDNKPEYGILAYWDEGNLISFYTKRPVVVSNSMWGYKTMADVFSSENERNSFYLCIKYKIKYILLNPSRTIGNQILSYWPILKNKPETPEYKLFYGKVQPRDKYDYFYFWLARRLGLTPLGNFTTTEHFRIVFANQNDGLSISKYIMFEKVDGAKANFIFQPNSKVSLSLEFKLGEMSLIYKINRTTDENGHCQFILPYSNDYNCGNIVTDPFYKISIEKDDKKELAKLVVTEQDVVEGKTIDLEKQFEVVEKK